MNRLIATAFVLTVIHLNGGFHLKSNTCVCLQLANSCVLSCENYSALTSTQRSLPKQTVLNRPCHCLSICLGFIPFSFSKFNCGYLLLSSEPSVLCSFLLRWTAHKLTSTSFDQTASHSPHRPLQSTSRADSCAVLTMRTLLFLEHRCASEQQHVHTRAVVNADHRETSHMCVHSGAFAFSVRSHAIERTHQHGRTPKPPPLSAHGWVRLW
mmetsp:Transcript_21302/g.46434  ORF Transcript_21302/g.46434 Transcript_21302/m.46434 type:complete len:211 (-) Transcript_21302:317-949(-)